MVARYACIWGSCRGVEPRLAILRTKDNVNNNLTERLRHWRSMDLKSAEMNRAFSADIYLGANSWGAAPGYLEPPPLALGCDLGKFPSTQHKIRPDKGRGRRFSVINLTKDAKLFTNEVSLSSANDLPQPHNRVVSRDGDAGLRQSDGANGADLAGR